jgi:adenylate cyclase
MGDVREGERGAAPDDPIRISGTYAGGGRPIATPDLVAWLLEHGRSIERIGAFVDELCWRAVATGIPLWRVTLHTATLHPQIEGLGCRWWRDRGVMEEFTITLGAEEHGEFLNSPIRGSVLNGEIARFRLSDVQGREFPLLGRLREAGGTDYLALPLFRLLDSHPVITWATDVPGGFTDDHIARLAALAPALGAVIEARLRRRIARDLLDTYLGRQAGRRVLAGQIRRGRGERVRAVIMASDLRGSTALSDHLPADEMIELLNAYFERVAAPVQAYGGDVLKFLGDGVLAIFPVDELGEANAAAAALQAATETLADLVALCHTLEHPDRPPLCAGIGLHLGDVFYGNVGAPGRLDFTVIGPAVNLAFRIESMTKELRRPLLASRAFARAVPTPLVALGTHWLRGIAEPEELFGAPSPGPEAAASVEPQGLAPAAHIGGRNGGAGCA